MLNLSDRKPQFDLRVLGTVIALYRGLQVAWHKNRDEIGTCAKFGGNFELKFCACADFVAIFVPSNLQSSVVLLRNVLSLPARRPQIDLRA